MALPGVGLANAPRPPVTPRSLPNLYKTPQSGCSLLNRLPIRAAVGHKRPTSGAEAPKVGAKCGTSYKAIAGASLLIGSRSISSIDSGLYRAWIGFKDWWSAYSTFFGRFEARGLVRILNDLACEGLTLSVGGLLVVLAFAIPAFDLAQGKMNLSDEYSVTFYDRFGNEIGKRGLLRDDLVPLDELPDFLIKATLATEDRRFFEHFGVDVMGTIRALAENARADAVVQGGSSLTQQLAKNMFLSPERALSRKIKEAFIAVYLENHYTKREILKLYFDRAYLGGGSYGVEAAARFYFGKSVRDVTLAEAAMLAGMFKAPTRYAPHIDMAASRARANEVLTNMVEAGYLTEGQVYGARMNPAKIVERGDYYSPDWFLDWAFEEVQRIMLNRKEHILAARTTVDIGLQKTGRAVGPANYRAVWPGPLLRPGCDGRHGA